jgi:cyclic pyranopterin phosphate synthase
MLERFRLFNERGGKFRVAILNACNLDCFFCHNEAMANPRRSVLPRAPPKLDDAAVVRLVNALTRLGGRQVNLTGGEPLAHPRLVPLLESIEKRATRIVLNTNAILASRLADRAKIANVDAVFASLHTLDDTLFRQRLGGRRVSDVTRGILALKRAGYEVQINFSLGPYNANAFEDVLTFACDNGLDLKAIALVRSSEEPGFYGGDWIAPGWLADKLAARGAKLVREDEGLGGHTATYRVGASTVKIKNVARGRLKTDFCRGCLQAGQCGEGIYGLRMGVDGVMKPCLLRRDRFRPLAEGDEASYERQVLAAVAEMIGDPSHAHFVGGAPL